MKKWLRPLLLLVLLLAALTVSAAAAEPTSAGMYQIDAASGTTITPRDGSGVVTKDDSITGYAGFYKDAVKFDVTCTGLTAGNQYLLLVLSDNQTPGADNIVYINQDVADSTGTVTFSDTDVAYPSSLVKGNTYHVYVVGADKTFTADTGAVATFQYFQPYTPGDVDEDTKINAVDALLILQYAVGKGTLNSVQKLAADVTMDTKIDAVDALNILQYAVGKPSVFD